MVNQQATHEHNTYEPMDGLLGKTKSNKSSNTGRKCKNRMKRGRKNHKIQYLNIFSANAAQLQGKLQSLKEELKTNNISIFTLQETHFSRKGKIQIESFEIFEAIRSKAKGGTAIGVLKGLKPVLIKEYSEEFELLVVEVKTTTKDIRIVTGYGPQESWPIALRIPFFNALEEEIVKAELDGKSIIVEIDGNSKLGPVLIPGDKHPQSENGRILAAIIERHGLVVGNAIPQCEGLITRKRVTKDSIEESTIDFVLVSADLVDEIESILVDEKRDHVLTKITKHKGNIKKVESDHNSIITRLKTQWKCKEKQNRIEIFNLKNKECQQIFRRETSSHVNNSNLSSIFEDNGDLNIQTEKFLKSLQRVIQKCFKKIRVKEKVDKEKEALFKKWKDLKNKDDDISKINLKNIENELADRFAQDYIEKIKKHVGNIDCLDGNMNSGTLWNLKKQLFPQSRDPPTAMVDPRNGQLLTNEDSIQDAALYAYKKRLENKPIKTSLEHIKNAKEQLCE